MHRHHHHTARAACSSCNCAPNTAPPHPARMHHSATAATRPRLFTRSSTGARARCLAMARTARPRCPGARGRRAAWHASLQAAFQGAAACAWRGRMRLYLVLRNAAPWPDTLWGRAAPAHAEARCPCAPLPPPPGRMHIRPTAERRRGAGADRLCAGARSGRLESAVTQDCALLAPCCGKLAPAAPGPRTRLSSGPGVRDAQQAGGQAAPVTIPPLSRPQGPCGGQPGQSRRQAA